MAFLRLQKRIPEENEVLQKDDFFWALQFLCDLKKIDINEFSSAMECTSAFTIDLLIQSAKLLGLRILKVHRPSCRISGKTLPSLALSYIKHTRKEFVGEIELRIDLIVGSSAGKISYIPALEKKVITARCDDYAKRYTENLLLILDDIKHPVLSTLSYSHPDPE